MIRVMKSGLKLKEGRSKAELGFLIERFRNLFFLFLFVLYTIAISLLTQAWCSYIPNLPLKAANQCSRSY